MTSEFAQGAQMILGDRLRQDVPLAPYTTFRVGGPAEWLADVRSADELTRLLALAADRHVAVTLLGGGSNVLVSDAGVKGVVIQIRMTTIEAPDADTVRADAGVTINGLVRWTVGRGLAGLERWAGTPGTVGGAIHGNAHWAGRNIGDLVRRARLASRTGVATWVEAGEMVFEYDTSRLAHTGEVLLSADFAVTAGESPTLRERARESLAYRKRTQPLSHPSAGCVFQNPDPSRDRVPDGCPPSAGALVDRAGLKGHRLGGAMISDAHANFIVHDGHATARDIKALIETARETVRDRFGVLLRDEVVYLGKF